MSPRNLTVAPAAVLLALLTAACGSDAVKLVKPGSVNVGKDYAVVATGDWSAWDLGQPSPPIRHLAQLNRWPNRFWTNDISRQSQVWTKQGYVLQELGFINGIRPGEEIIRYSPKGKELRYKGDMDGAALAQLIAGLLFSDTDDSFELSKVEPVRIGGHEAKYFTARHSAKVGFQYGLDYRTAVYAFADKDHLDFAYFSAPALLYYDRYWPEADNIIRSIRFRQTP